jgi:ferritin-like metal-binding protein YciE
MTKIAEPRELLVHELRDILYAETKLEQVLPRLADEATDDGLRAGFAEHLGETREHIENLKQVFESLGEAARPQTCRGIDGITAEHDAFVDQHDATPVVVDLYLAGAGARAEHYEIAAYTGMVRLAKALGEDVCADLLSENLEDERAALETLEAAARRLGAAGAPAGAR